jgi:hypothetical protein
MKQSLLIIAAALAVPALVAAEEPTKNAYVPGLGEFMMATQLRHAKLWFAGEAKNWDLARYEIDEIKEGLDDAAEFDPTHDGIPVADMLKANLGAPLAALIKAADGKDSVSFSVAFDKLTAGCNACHAGAQHGFIVIQRPTTLPVSNQAFGTDGK